MSLCVFFNQYSCIYLIMSIYFKNKNTFSKYHDNSKISYLYNTNTYMSP